VATPYASVAAHVEGNPLHHSLNSFCSGGTNSRSAPAGTLTLPQGKPTTERPTSAHRLLVYYLRTGAWPGSVQTLGAVAPAPTPTATRRSCATPGNGQTGSGPSKAATASAGISPTGLYGY